MISIFLGCVVSLTKPRVVIVALLDCPIARSYAPLLERLAVEFKGKADFDIKIEDQDVNLAAAKKWMTEFKLSFVPEIDKKHRFAKKMGVTTVPTALVFDSSGKCVYVGRIDNRYADLGIRRQHATQSDLRNKLVEVLNGHKMSLSRTTVVGCSLPLD